MFEELRPDIYTIGAAVTGLSGGFWFTRAKQGTTDNYAVFSYITNTNDRDTVNNFERVFLQINIYSQSLTTSETLVKNMKAAFDDSESSFSLTSWHFIRIKRNLVRGPVDLGDIYQTTIQYEIDLQKK